MNSQTLEKYANLLCHYCLDIKPGQHVLVKSTHVATPLLQALHKVITRCGACVEYRLEFPEKSRIFYENSSQALRQTEPFLYAEAIKHADALLTIRAPYDIATLSAVPEEHKLEYQQAKKNIKKTLLKRSAAGKLRWCLCVYPSPSMAASCHMSIEEYEKFVSKACFLDKKNPEESWGHLSHYQNQLITQLQKKSKFHIIGKNTDLRFSCKGRKWINSNGKRNMPSGEVFSCPIENSVSGYIHFTYPSIYQGREVAGVTLTFEKGKVVHHTAQMGQHILDAVLKIPGANRLGEIAFGTNTHIQRATKEILFDEKIGGSIHAAIGSSYPETGGKNKSAIHWDMIKDMSIGKVYADDELIYENGTFLPT